MPTAVPASTTAPASSAAPSGDAAVVDDPTAGAAAPPRVPALSPSRAADFMQCPLLYRFRVVDRLPEPPSAAATRGTVVHAVLERLFDLPATERTVAAARGMLGPAWQELLAEEPGLGALFGDDDGAAAAWLDGAGDLLERYFTLEDPTRLEPAERELYVETDLEQGLRLRGYVDRLDVAPTGAVRVVDYKTGRAPGPAFEAKALFQMKFYGLVVWRTRGVLPAMLQLVYLGSGDVLRYTPTEDDLLATERKVLALWEAIERAARTGDWRTSPGRLCDWCHHKGTGHCPAWGGTPPTLPEGAAARALGLVPSPGSPVPGYGPTPDGAPPAEG